MLLRSTRLSLARPNAPLFQDFSPHYLRILRNHQSFHQQELGLRYAYPAVHNFDAHNKVLLHAIVLIPVFLQQQLQSLLETLSATEPHYIRCVKPNNVLKPAIFENSNVLQQLRCGVRLENLVISPIVILNSVSFPIKVQWISYEFGSRESWRLLGLVVQDFPLGKLLMNLLLVLAFWDQMFSRGGSFTKFSLSLSIALIFNVVMIHHSLDMLETFFYLSCICYVPFFFCYSNGPTACKKLLEKANLQGYQVYFSNDTLAQTHIHNFLHVYILCYVQPLFFFFLNPVYGA